MLFHNYGSCMAINFIWLIAQQRCPVSQFGRCMICPHEIRFVDLRVWCLLKLSFGPVTLLITLPGTDSSMMSLTKISFLQYFDRVSLLNLSSRSELPEENMLQLPLYLTSVLPPLCFLVPLLWHS